MEDISHYYCINCNKDLSCNYERETDFTEGKHPKLFYLEKCPYCGGEIKAGFPKKFVNLAYADNERLSWTLGCDEHQLPKMMKKHPGAEFRKAKSGGYQMVIKNRTEKLRRYKEAGAEEYTLRPSEI